MNGMQRRALAKKIYKEIQNAIDEWHTCDFVKVHWSGDISVDGEYFEKWRLQDVEEND